MPWNPVKMYPDVMQELKRMGYARQVNIDSLHVAVMRVLGVIKQPTIKTHIEAMEKLGYLKQSVSAVGIFDVLIPGKPIKDDGDPDLDNYIESTPEKD